jgi:peptidoglycan hydrolase-like amidase
MAIVAAIMTRRHFLSGSLAAFAAPGAEPVYSFWVFGLLKPTDLNIYPQANSRLHCRSANGTAITEGGQATRIGSAATPFFVSGPDGTPVRFLLEVPGVIRRCYFGTLAIYSEGRLLRAVITMDRETAVSSIAGAELPARATPLAALAAQAVAARSFLCVALNPRHHDAQFCDTTHCQFLRSPAAAGSLVEQATHATQRLVLTNGSSVIPAHYSAACGGHTDSAELDHYRYQAVICEPCRRDHIARRGHGLGLCQTGAISLAHAGWNWRDIAAKYYPGCVIRSA